MIHEAYMPVYMGPRFSLHTGPPEVVQEALADLKMGDFQRIENDDHCTEGRRKIYSDFDYFDNDDLL